MLFNAPLYLEVLGPTLAYPWPFMIIAASVSVANLNRCEHRLWG